MVNGGEIRKPSLVCSEIIGLAFLSSSALNGDHFPVLSSLPRCNHIRPKTAGMPSTIIGEPSKKRQEYVSTNYV